MKHTAHLSTYQAIISLYPSEFQSAYRNEMQALFEDQLFDDGPAKTWANIFRELPASLWREHYQNITGRKLDFMVDSKDITAMATGMIILVALPILFLGRVLELVQPILFSEVIFGGGDPRAPYAIVLYTLCGAIIASIAPRHALRNAIIIGAATPIIMTLVEFGMDLYIAHQLEPNLNAVAEISYNAQMVLWVTAFCTLGAYITHRFIKKSV